MHMSLKLIRNTLTILVLLTLSSCASHGYRNANIGQLGQILHAQGTQWQYQGGPAWKTPQNRNLGVIEIKRNNTGTNYSQDYNSEYTPQQNMFGN